MALGFTSALLSAIQKPDSDIKMDMYTSSWYASSVTMSINVGAIAASCLVPKFGRRITFIINSLPAIIGSILTYFATDVTALMIGRILIGSTIGSNSMIGLVNIGEYTSPQNRGMFLNMSTVSLSIGSLIVHALGYYTTWRTLVLFSAIPFMLSFLIAYTWPESPSWLAEKKKYEKSREAFYWLRGRTQETTREIEQLIRAQGHKKINKTVTEHVADFFRKFQKKNFLKPLFVICVAIILEESGGRHVFPSYAAQLIKEVTSNDINKFYYNIVIDILIVFSGITSSYLIRVMRMRTLLFTSGTATFVTLSLASLSLYLVKSGTIFGDYSIVSLVLFGTFFVLSNLGCTCIPIALKGEIFPLEHRVVASVSCYFMSTFTASLYLKTMPILISAFYIYSVFAGLAVCIATALFVLYFVLPETKDRTLQEIEDYFSYGKFRDGELIPTEDMNNKCGDHELLGR